MARETEARDFATLGTIGRVIDSTHDELIALTAAAAVTERIGLLTDVLLGPLFDPIVLARQAASLDQVSDGRFTLGLGVGWNPADYATLGRDFHRHGMWLDEAVETMQAVWRGERINDAMKVISPTPSNGSSVPLAFGGNVAASFRRAATHGVGWTAGGATPDQAAALSDLAKAAWAEAGREGRPYPRALAYFGLGPDARTVGEAYLTDCSGDWGPGMAAGTPKDPAAIQATAETFKSAGADELLFMPTNSDLGQVAALHEALGGTTTV